MYVHGLIELTSKPGKIEEFASIKKVLWIVKKERSFLRPSRKKQRLVFLLSEFGC